MPSVSGKQHRAMEAAKHGNSTLGIPQSVGADFVAADTKHGLQFDQPKQHARNGRTPSSQAPAPGGL